MPRLSACGWDEPMVPKWKLALKATTGGCGLREGVAKDMGVREGETWTAKAQGSQGRWVEDVRQGCHHAKSAPSVKPHVMASTCVSPSLVRALTLPMCKVAVHSPLDVCSIECTL